MPSKALPVKLLFFWLLLGFRREIAEVPMGRKHPDLMQTSLESVGLVACLELTGG